MEQNQPNQQELPKKSDSGVGASFSEGGQAKLMKTAQKIPKSVGFLAAFIPTLILFLTPYLGIALDSKTAVTLLPFIVFFVLIPILDKAIGYDEEKFVLDDQRFFTSQNYYVGLLLLTVPVQMGLIVWGASIFVSDTFSVVGDVAWIVGTGFVTSALGITVAHELVHKNSRFLQAAGGVLLSTVCYPGFKVEHVRGHHVNVGTPEDPTTAKFRESIFNFLPKALTHNVMAAFILEAKRLEKHNVGPISWRNELIWWWGLSFCWLLLLTNLFGAWGGLYFIGQALVAAITLETINYVEHYGLERRQLENGKYERVTEQHSWNSNFFLSNLMLFQLQRHSDHHAIPKTLYAELACREEAPQLPYGYPTMLILAWFPSVWFKLMNPRVRQWREVNGHTTSAA